MSRAGLIPHEEAVEALEALDLAAVFRVPGSNLRALRDFDAFEIQRVVKRAWKPGQSLEGEDAWIRICSIYAAEDAAYVINRSD